MNIVDGPVSLAVVLMAAIVLAVSAVAAVAESRPARSVARCLVAIGVPLALATLAVTIVRFATVR